MLVLHDLYLPYTHASGRVTPWFNNNHMIVIDMTFVIIYGYNTKLCSAIRWCRFN
jgi:hypothetical protein